MKNVIIRVNQISQELDKSDIDYDTVNENNLKDHIDNGKNTKAGNSKALLF